MMRHSAKVLMILSLVLLFSDFGVEAATTINGGTISTNTSWTLAGSPYTVKGTVSVEGPSAPVLTIQAGVVVKFAAGKMLKIGSGNLGGLQAVGTAASPITFQGEKANTNWQGLKFFSKTVTASTLVAYATVIKSSGGIYAENCSFTIHHVAFTNNSVGIDTTGAALTIYQNSFSGNSIAVRSTTALNAPFCWWNSANGPNTSGAQTTSGTVAYDPWLVAAPSNAQFFLTPFSVSNRTFNPAIGINFHVSFTTQLTGNWAVSFLTSSSVVVKTFTGSGTGGNVTWDGRDTSGTALPVGAYKYKLESVSGTGQTATAATGQLTISSAALQIDPLNVTPSFFSPNGDGIQDALSISGTINYPDALWTVNVKNSSGAILKTISGGGGSFTTTWDGKNTFGILQPDGVYTAEVLASDEGASASRTGTSILDATMPVSGMTSPLNNSLLSNFYQNWVPDVTIVGTADDANLSNWTLERGVGTSPVTWNTLASGSVPRLNVTLCTWATATSTNGIYTLRLRVTDLAGNQVTQLRTVTVGNFLVSQNSLQFNGASSGSVSYTSTVPFNVTETILIRNASGQIVKTLASAARSAGTYVDSWNGRNQQGGLAPDGPYFYFIDVSDGSTTKTWDLSNQFYTASNNYYATTSGWDAWNNQPLAITYNFGYPGRVLVQLAANHNPGSPPIFPDDCVANVCLKYHDFEESGPHTIYWAMVDNNGLPRPDINVLGIATEQNTFPKNGVVLFGSKPTINTLRAIPPVFYPGTGSQQSITFTLGTYQNVPATITVSILSHATASTLRTITQSISPGSVIIPWDGKSDGGNFVAPGGYTITVTATDALGNQVFQRALTTVRY